MDDDSSPVQMRCDRAQRRHGAPCLPTGSLINTVPATAADFTDPASTSDTTGGGPVAKTFTDTGRPGLSRYAADRGERDRHLAVGADGRRGHVWGRGRHGAVDPALSDQHLLQRRDQRPEIDEYQTLYDSPTCKPVTGVTTCNPAGTPFTIAQILASIDLGMFSHMMGNDPRPRYFHQSNLMSQTTGGATAQGDGLFYQTLDPLLAEYHGYFVDNAPIVQYTMAQIGTLLSEQAGWAAANVGQVRGYIQGATVNVSNSGSAIELPLTGTTLGSPYTGTPVLLDARAGREQAPTRRWWRGRLPRWFRRSSRRRPGPGGVPPPKPRAPVIPPSPGVTLPTVSAPCRYVPRRSGPRTAW